MTTAIARINASALNSADEDLSAEELRQRACSELLRQAAIAQGLLGADDALSHGGVVSEAASGAIETLLEQNLHVPEPSLDECRRHYTVHQAVYTTGERVHARHILFAITPGVDVAALRNRAESCLMDLRGRAGKDLDDGFAQAASTLSTCPSGALGGDLGWLGAADCAPELAKELFGNSEPGAQSGVQLGVQLGVFPRLVHSRFGFHVLEVLERQPGVQQDFADVQGAVAMALRQESYIAALRQYLRQLAASAKIVGVDLDVSASPLPQ